MAICWKLTNFNKMGCFGGYWLYFFVIFLTIVPNEAIIKSPPQIIKQPPTEELLFQVKSRADEAVKPFILECEADGEPTPEYFWTKDGKPFDWQNGGRMTQRAGSGTLIINSPREEDVGKF